jgi:hypothetical protein
MPCGTQNVLQILKLLAEVRRQRFRRLQNISVFD